MFHEQPSFGCDIWMIPGERMQVKETHCVPLAAPVVAMLKAAQGPEETEAAQALVFPAVRGKVLSDMTLMALLGNPPH
jgi:hypothetical protein